MDAYIYQYIIGTLVFLIGIVYAVKQEYIGFTGRKALYLLLLLAGLAFFMAIQGYLQYSPMESADQVPYQGGAERKKILGTPLDYAIMIAYFLAILAIGTYFGRRQKTVKDFFFSGQRFSWWLIAFSLVATTVGSYSFVKYSRVAFEYGLSSSQSYLNDWFWVPLLVFGWLPILYFSRVTSIPEYFERRFDSKVRIWATVIILIYLIGYVGVNLFTMGKALNVLVGWPIPVAAIIVATISAIYVTFGGQTSVIMTDLFQGIMLLATGIIILVLGICYLDGFENFWENLPRPHRLAFANFNKDPSFSGTGIFWQDAMANSAMFYFINQGIIMRFMAAKSIRDARRAMIVVPIVLMPIAACVVASGGWVGKALVHAGILPTETQADEAFFVAAEFLSRPGLFGFTLAALTAALMSTVDTLITAVSAIVVNDVYKPYIKPQANEKQLLRIARISAVSVTALGIALVPVFMDFPSIYSAHGAFTAAVTPPLVITLLLSVFWRRFTRKAALLTLIGGLTAMIISFAYPQVITPFAHGVPMGKAGDGFLGGFQQYKFMRAFYGLSVCSVIAVITALLTKPEPFARCRGLVWGTIADAIKHYKGSPGKESAGIRSRALPRLLDQPDRFEGAGRLPIVNLSQKLAQDIQAKTGDLIYITDTRTWLGGLHSAHTIVGQITTQSDRAFVEMGPQTYQVVVTPKRKQKSLIVENLY
ncbi:MAG: sodium:solute symporter family protein [Planctomycetota bacterium]